MPLSSLLLDTPPYKNMLPHVTAAMIADEIPAEGSLCEMHIVHDRAFRWFHVVDDISRFNPADLALPAHQVLLLIHDADVRKLEESHPSLSFLACADDLHTLLRVQNLFVTISMWEDALNKIVLQNGSLGELLDASVPILKNFMFVSDNNFNIVAYTAEVAPPDPLHASIIETGCLTQQTIAEERFRLPEETFYTRRASAISPYDRASFPIHLHHTYFGSVSMSCNIRPDTQGLRDTFLILANRVQAACERIWAKETMRDMN